MLRLSHLWHSLATHLPREQGNILWWFHSRTRPGLELRRRSTMKTVEAEPGTPGKWLRRMFDESLPRRPFPSRKQSWHSPRMESDHQTLNQRQVRFSRFPVKGIYAFSLDVFNLSFIFSPSSVSQVGVCWCLGRLETSNPVAGQKIGAWTMFSEHGDGDCDGEHIRWLSFGDGDHIGWLGFGRYTFPCNDYL